MGKKKHPRLPIACSIPPTPRVALRLCNHMGLVPGVLLGLFPARWRAGSYRLVCNRLEKFLENT